MACEPLFREDLARHVHGLPRRGAPGGAAIGRIAALVLRPQAMHNETEPRVAAALVAVLLVAFERAETRRPGQREDIEVEFTGRAAADHTVPSVGCEHQQEHSREGGKAGQHQP
jgi:hypothetical protein